MLHHVSLGRFPRAQTLDYKKKPSLDAIGEIIVTENDVTY